VLSRIITKSGVEEAIASIKHQGPAGWAVHRGEILREEFLEPMGISAYRLAVELRVSPPDGNDIVREKRGDYSREGRPAGQVFRDFRAVLAQLQGAFAVHQVKEKLHEERRAIKPLAAQPRRDSEPLSPAR